MVKLTAPALLRAALAVLALAAAAAAQVPGDARASLANFPESQAVLHVNARRIVNEALPRLVPKADYARMIAESRKVGFDVRDLHSLTVGVRFAEGAPAGAFPEVLVVLRGDFSADALVTLARFAASTQNIQPREENYLGRPIQVFDLPVAGKEGEGPKPPPLPFKEVAAVALNPNTLIVGVPGYVRAALDADGGRGRLRASLVDLAARDPRALWSLTAELPENMAQHVQRLGLPPNEEFNRVIGWLRQVSLSNGMDALNFTFRAAVLADSPDHANALSGLVRMGLTAAESSARSDIERKRLKPREAWQSRAALKAMSTFVNRVEGQTLVLGVSFRQADLAQFVRTEFIKKRAPKGPGSAKGRGQASRRR